MNLRYRTILSPFCPSWETLQHYTWGKFRRDLVAGLTVSVVEIPQAMAYAVIAGVDPVYGIYASIIQGVLGALLSSSEHLTTGPTNTQSLLIASSTTVVMRSAEVPDPESYYLLLVFTLTVMKGFIQLMFWAFRFGELVQFISRSVLLGVASGAAILIVSGQMASFLGISRSSALTEDPTLFGVARDIIGLLPRLHEVNPVAVLLGLLTIGITVGARQINRFIPGALIGVVLSAGLVATFDLSVPVLGKIQQGLPHFQPPVLDIHVWQQLLPGALALALLGGIESVAIAKTIAARSGEKIIPNQEFFAQGFKNAVTGFFQCIPGSASFTRSALDYEAGAATRFAAVLNAIFVGIIFLLFADYARFIPYAALGGVLFVVAWGLLDLKYFLRVYRADRSDAVVFAVTFLSTILLPLQYAVFIGIFLNIAFYLRTSSRLHIAEMVQTDTGAFFERPIYDKQSGERKVIFVQIEGELFFALADQLRDQLTSIQRSSVRVVVIRLKRCHSIDATILDVLENFVKDMQKTRRHVLLCGVKPEISRVLRDYGLDRLIGPVNIFPAEAGVFSSARRALMRARIIVGSSIDVSNIKVDDEGEITYEI